MAMIDLAVLGLFWFLLLSTVSVSCLFGRSVERWFAGGLVMASLSTLVLRHVSPAVDKSVNVMQLWDAAILVCVLALAARSERHWPIWFAGFQTLTVISELLAQVNLAIPRMLFANLAAFWALPAMVVMVSGILQDWRAQREGRFDPVRVDRAPSRPDQRPAGSDPA